ncbi:PAQR family membrane homeostasis protein TrhA [Thiopseudomonas alkaliphila]|uniref:PAQR family membrane homeostasis protein TrhA n=1 Tax=Thiopseudomonas alkaliphila TaxID=1697053 RepID=UPI00069EA7C3|nr:hemolysin III family protein [Thiopseudomonas alkaliphila]AKX50456.1 hemolysin III [Thiopseudomonas alkaliphila]AKX56792.1 hemolysin III [Thiopseudomonas alkaliphila]
MYYGERFNAISHCVGAVLALIGCACLVISSAWQGAVKEIVSASVYGGSLVTLYTTSTLYHSVSGRLKQIFQKLDHCAIYLLIAGSYTPFTLITLEGAWGWTLFGINWSLAVIGIIQEFWLGKRTRVLSLIIYLVMGWLIVIALKPLVAAMPVAGLAWLVGGGVTYSLGVIFFVLDEKIQHGHGIWHLFVLAGSIMQFISIFVYVL